MLGSFVLRAGILYNTCTKKANKKIPILLKNQDFFLSF